MFTLFPVAFTFPSAGLVLGWFLFGCIGTVAVGYAKWKEEWLPAVLGVALMVFPYFFPSGVVFWVVGVGLTVALVFPARLLGWR